MYHQVGLFSRPRAHKGLYCHIDSFRRQMRYLHRSGLAVISLQDAYDGLFCGRALPNHAVVLTFDDGYQNFYDFAWPVLQRYGFPATVFIVAGHTGGHADWLDGPHTQTPRLMDATSLRSLARQGVTIGSHSVHHHRLGALETQASRTEIHDSKARLEELLGQPVAHFCYPYGHYDRAVREAVREAGYLTGLTTIRGRADQAANAYEIPRQGISYKDTRLHYAYKLHLKHADRFKNASR